MSAFLSDFLNVGIVPFCICISQPEDSFSCSTVSTLASIAGLSTVNSAASTLLSDFVKVTSNLPFSVFSIESSSVDTVALNPIFGI
ncbi:hypothetical protein FKM82_020162 [Ascaphus truei]